MAGLLDTLARLARSPQGQAAIRSAREMAARPENREKLNNLVAKISKKGGPPPR